MANILTDNCTPLPPLPDPLTVTSFPTLSAASSGKILINSRFHTIHYFYVV